MRGGGLTSSSVPLAHVLRRRPAPTWRAGSLAAALSIAISTLLLLQGVPGAHRAPAPSAPRGGFARAGLMSLPAGARGPVSAALGAASPAYRVSGAGGALVAENPAQHLSARFGAAGVALGAGALHVALSVRAIGYDGALSALAPVAPRASGNRVVYSHRGLAEWYRNGPLGIEQGFTVLRAPRRPAGRLTLSMLLAADAQAAIAPGAQALVLRRGGRALLGYGGLSATDARGRPLRSWLALHDGHVLVNVDTRGARYPLRIDPLIHEGEKLTASGLSGPYGYVGMSVALSADGNTALIGAPADGEYSGAAYVFTRTGASWSQQGAKLTGSDTVSEAWFGESVALSADGDTAVIGGPSDNAAVGAAWVFTRSGSSWSQQGEKLTGGGESGAGYFGRSVALSADGDTALIGG